MSVAAEVAAVAALQQGEYLKDVRDKIVKERERLFTKLQQFPLLRYICTLL